MREIDSVWQVLPDETIRVLVSPALPGTFRVTKVDGHPRLFCEQLVHCEFSPSIPGQREEEPSRQVVQRSDERRDDRLRVLASHPHEDQVPGVPLDERGNVTVLRACDQVALPVAGLDPVLDVRWPVAD